MRVLKEEAKDVGAERIFMEIIPENLTKFDER